MPEALPRRAPMPWLPALGELARRDPLWEVRDGARGLYLLRVWKAGAGHFAVVTELGIGRSVTNAAHAIRAQLAAEFGEPLGLAEHWPESQAPEAGEHVDLVLPGDRWAPLWPVGRKAPHYEVCRAWWEAYGPEITGIPG
jgi:hypothetical protein